MASLPTAPPSQSALGEMFGWDGPVTALTPVEGGWTHRVWRVETPFAVYAVKQFLRDDKPALGQLERAARYEMSIWADGGIGMARPCVAGDGRIIVDDFPLLDGSTGWVRAHDWVGGSPLHGGAACTLGTAGQVGALLARLHRRQVPANWDPRLAVACTGSAEWANIAELLDADGGAPSGRGARLRALRPFVATMEGLSDDLLGTVVLSHGGVNQTNCLDAAGGGITLLDWDDAGPVDSLHELGYAVLEWAGAGRGQPDLHVAREVLRGYTAHGGELGTSTGSLPAPWVAAAGRWTITNAAVVASPGGIASDRVEGARFQLDECLDKLERAQDSWTAWMEALRD